MYPVNTGCAAACGYYLTGNCAAAAAIPVDHQCVNMVCFTSALVGRGDIYQSQMFHATSPVDRVGFRLDLRLTTVSFSSALVGYRDSWRP
ncbi:unnamed protein product [Dibothriocephalus latus]|uniref:Uncharacterized protein n=1 Tax=Dibothriocephalus latus TaxID=60516 RepID=A0A3P6U5W7_DIBLA|nr:unnamed protein product [Dibothriocephalus latus]